MAAEQRVALVTGGNRGLGFATAQQLAQAGMKVLIGSREAENGEAAAQSLQQQGLDVLAYQLSVTDRGGIKVLAQLIETKFGRLDVLINNAGIYPDSDGDTLLTTNLGSIREALETNTYGPISLCQTCVPLMQANGYGRIVNVSSGMGQLNDMGGGSPAYRLSKTALNSVTRILAAELEGTNIKVNSVCPGWVQTDMGGSEAPRTPAEGADTIAWLAQIPDDAPSGLFWRDRTPIPW
ncbi:short-chain dehydrogenase [filamentous cyanobacterium CCP5]|nr:short-chain dehydrogenase [filamentous cyanobacterium CCP5]